MEELKAGGARAWTCGTSSCPNDRVRRRPLNVDYAPLCELMGRNLLTAEATNCAAPDTGNMEILAEFGTDGAAGAVARSRCSKARSARASR